MSDRYDIAVVGGGAAGMMAAVHALTIAPNLSICVLDRQPRVGKKLLATGNGRCNILNLHPEKSRYHGSLAFLDEAFSRFPPARVLAAFEQMGLYCAAETDGRVYPSSDQAASVLDALRLTLAEKGASILTQWEAMAVRRGLTIVSATGECIDARRVILAVGGPASPKLGGTALGGKLLCNAGHETAPFSPALCPLKTDAQAIKALKGVRFHGAISLVSGGRTIRREEGEILFSDGLLSGIAAMQLARDASALIARAQKPCARLETRPGKPEDTQALLYHMQRNAPERTMENFLSGLVNKRLGQVLAKNAGLSLDVSAGDLTDGDISRLSALITGWTLPVTGVQGFDGAQVASGGATCRDIDARTLQSRLLPGLFVAGEALDVDGDCGGFNLLWAWASGMLAAEECVRSLS